ncbi:type I restriction-modification system subunit M N-terminal domain-containing protein [Providencia rettgeri]
MRELQGKLWDIADLLRGKMHADEFRDYCLGFIFYKYLSELLMIMQNSTKLGRKDCVKMMMSLNQTGHLNDGKVHIFPM